MITLKTVLKSGGIYKPDHVLRMCEMFDKYVDLPAKFVCYSDMDIPGITVRELQHNWKGWWSKIEMFRDRDEKSFYIDLDMTVRGNINDVVGYNCDFIALRNLNTRIEGIGSAVMGWQGDYSFIYQTFLKDPNYFISQNNRIGTNNWGDQSFIWKMLNGNIKFYQDIFPNRFSRFDINPKADVLVYFGKRKPW